MAQIMAQVCTILPQPLLSAITFSSVPPDDQLQVALRMYEIEGLPIKERLGRLEAEFGYCIKSVYYHCKCYTFTYSRERKKKLNTLNNKFGILSARKTSKTMSQSIATSLVVAQLDRDVHSRNGPEAIKRFLAIRGISIPRYVLYHILILINDRSSLFSRRMIRIAAREHDPYKDKSGLCSRCHILDALKELPNEQTRLAVRGIILLFHVLIHEQYLGVFSVCSLWACHGSTSQGRCMLVVSRNWFDISPCTCTFSMVLIFLRTAS